MAKLKRRTINQLAQAGVPIRRGMTEEQAQAALARRAAPPPRRDPFAPGVRQQPTAPPAVPTAPPAAPIISEEQGQAQLAGQDPSPGVEPPDFSEAPEGTQDKAQGFLDWLFTRPQLSMSPVAAIYNKARGNKPTKEIFQDLAGANFKVLPQGESVKTMIEKAKKAHETGDWTELTPDFIRDMGFGPEDGDGEGGRPVGDVGQQFALERFEPEQVGLIRQAVEDALAGLKQPQTIEKFGEEFEPIAEQARRGFQKQIPTLQERFTALTGGGQRTAALPTQIQTGLGELESQLAGQRAQFARGGQQLAQQRLSSLLGAGLTPTKEPIFRPTAPGFMEQLAGAAAPGVGKGIGTGITKLIAALGGI